MEDFINAPIAKKSIWTAVFLVAVVSYTVTSGLLFFVAQKTLSLYLTGRTYENFVGNESVYWPFLDYLTVFLHVCFTTFCLWIMLKLLMTRIARHSRPGTIPDHVYIYELPQNGRIMLFILLLSGVFEMASNYYSNCFYKSLEPFVYQEWMSITLEIVFCGNAAILLVGSSMIFVAAAGAGFINFPEKKEPEYSSRNVVNMV